MNYTDYIEKARDLANSVYDQGVKALSKTETERRLAEALSHANWGASTTLMGEIAASTSDLTEFQVIMREIWAACEVTGRNWRVVYKGLALLEFLLKNGHKRVIQEAKENRSKIRRLETFSYQRDGVEKGTGVREKAKAVTELLDDDELLKRERAEAAKLRSKFTGVGRDGQQSGISSGMGGYDDFEDVGEKVGSDISDDEDSKKKSKKKSSTKKKSSSKKKGSDDEEEAEAAEDSDDFGSSKKSTSKSKKKQQNEDDDDIDFSPKFSKKETKSSSKKKEDDDDDFGFSDDDSKKKKPSTTSTTAVKAGPLASISVKIPGVGGSSSTSTSSVAKKSQEKEVDLLGDFDPFGTSSASTTAKPPTASVSQPQSAQQNQAANILNMFNTPSAPASSAPSGMNAFGAFPTSTPAAPSQPSFAPQMGGFPGSTMGSGGGGFPQMGGMYPSQPMMMPQQQQPMGMMGGGHQPMGMMMGGQQPMGMMMPPSPMGGQQPQMMMMGGGFPPMGQPQQQAPMMMGGMGMPQQQPQMMMGSTMQPQMMGGMNTMGAAQAKKPAEANQKKDAFSGLMDLSFSAAPSSGGNKGGSLI